MSIHTDQSMKLSAVSCVFSQPILSSSLPALATLFGVLQYWAEPSVGQ